MAEVFALAAGIVGCLAAAGSAIKFSASLYQSSREVHGASEDIEKFAKNVRMFGHCVEAAFMLLKPFQHLAANENTPVLQYLLEYEVFDLIYSQTQSIKKDICRHRNKLRDLRSKGRWMVGWKWTLQKKEVAILELEMDRVRLTLDMTMNSLRLEVLHGLAPSEDVLKEMARLKRENKMHIRTIEKLQDKLEETQTSHVDAQPEETFVSLNRKVQKALQVLEKCMVREGRVPGHPPPQLSSVISSLSSRNSSRRNSTVNTSYSTFPVSERYSSSRTLPLVVSTTPEPEVIAFSPKRIYRSGTPYHSRPMTIPLIQDLDGVGYGKHFIEFPISGAQQKPSETVMGTGNEACTPTVDTVTIFPPPQSTSDFLAVYKKNNFLHLDPMANYRAEQGYIKTPNGTCFIIARFDKNLGENFVTLAFASRCQLDNVEFFDLDNLANPGEVMWVQVGDGKRERCVGRVTLLWGMGAENGSQKLRINCWVCVHGVGDVVFGKRFLERKQHY